MRLNCSLILFALLMGCSGASNTTKESVPVGWFDQAKLKTAEYPAFSSRYDTVQIEQQFVELIRQVHQGIDILVFFGTWCGDSKREVPRFLKIADVAAIPAERIRFYALDRSKKSSDGLTDVHRIEKVATFIFLKEGKELGRITEKPLTTIEADMLSILANAAGG